MKTLNKNYYKTRKVQGKVSVGAVFTIALFLTTFGIVSIIGFNSNEYYQAESMEEESFSDVLANNVDEPETKELDESGEQSIFKDKEDINFGPDMPQPGEAIVKYTERGLRNDPLIYSRENRTQKQLKQIVDETNFILYCGSFDKGPLKMNNGSYRMAGAYAIGLNTSKEKTLLLADAKIIGDCKENIYVDDIYNSVPAKEIAVSDIGTLGLYEIDIPVKALAVKITKKIPTNYYMHPELKKGVTVILNTKGEIVGFNIETPEGTRKVTTHRLCSVFIKC